MTQVSADTSDCQEQLCSPRYCEYFIVHYIQLLLLISIEGKYIIYRKKISWDIMSHLYEIIVKLVCNNINNALNRQRSLIIYAHHLDHRMIHSDLLSIILQILYGYSYVKISKHIDFTCSTTYYMLTYFFFPSPSSYNKILLR